jgi:hypothetical protein
MVYTKQLHWNGMDQTESVHMEDSSWVQMFDIQDIQEMKVY